MSTAFDVISEDFLSEIEAINALVALVEAGGGSSKSRVASINSATLLLAATFEEFVREMARQYARDLVARTTDPKNLPRKLTATVWKRTLEELARAKIDTGGTPVPLPSIASGARASFEAVCRFIEGDTTQEIYKNLIHNENNMRPEQINNIFRICNISNICIKISSSASLKEHFDEEDEGKTHNKFVIEMNDFMEKRNDITHALNPGNSVGADILRKNMNFLRAVALAMAQFLSGSMPPLEVGA